MQSTLIKWIWFVLSELSYLSNTRYQEALRTAKWLIKGRCSRIISCGGFSFLQYNSQVPKIFWTTLIPLNPLFTMSPQSPLTPCFPDPLFPLAFSEPPVLSNPLWTTCLSGVSCWFCSQFCETFFADLHKSFIKQMDHFKSRKTFQESLKGFKVW